MATVSGYTDDVAIMLVFSKSDATVFHAESTTAAPFAIKYGTANNYLWAAPSAGSDIMSAVPFAYLSYHTKR